MQGVPEDKLALAGYLCVALGVVDGMVAILMLLTGKPADPRARRNLALMFGVGGVVLLATGTAFLLKVFAKEG